MKDTEYTFAVARIRSNEYRLLTNGDYDALISAKDYNDAVSKLNSRGYELKGTDYTGALSERLSAAWKLVTEVLPDKHALDSLIIFNDFANLKIIHKSMLTGENPDRLFESPSVYDPYELKTLVNARKNGYLPEELAHADRSAYQILTKTGFAQLSDAVTDRASLEWSIKLSSKAENAIVSALAEINAALADIKILYRCIKTGKTESFMHRAVCECRAFDKKDIIRAAVCGEEKLGEYLSHTDFSKAAKAIQESPTVFEKYCDDAKIELLKSAKTETFGIAPVVAYYYAMQSEIKNVRIILSAKLNGLNADEIKKRVRESYV